MQLRWKTTSISSIIIGDCWIRILLKWSFGGTHFFDAGGIAQRDDEPVDQGAENQAQEFFKLPHIIFPYALPYENAVVVERLHAHIAYFAMSGKLTHVDFADMAETMIFQYFNWVEPCQSWIWQC